MLCRWDYGYQTTAMANRTVLVDNNTWNNTHIATVGRAMASPEKQAWEIFRSLDCTHVLVIFGGFIGYAPSQILASGACTLSLKQAVALIGPLIRAAESTVVLQCSGPFHQPCVMTSVLVLCYKERPPHRRSGSCFNDRSSLLAALSMRVITMLVQIPQR